MIFFKDIAATNPVEAFKSFIFPVKTYIFFIKLSPSRIPIYFFRRFETHCIVWPFQARSFRKEETGLEMFYATRYRFRVVRSCSD